MTVSERIEQLKTEALSAVSSSASTADLEEVRVRFLGRSAELTEIKKTIGKLSPEERKEVGRSSNLASREIEAALDSRTEEVTAREQEERLRAEAVDVTLPGVPFQRGHLHPSQIVIDDVVDFFVGLVVWQPGELEAELQRDFWFVMKGDSEMVFRKSTDGLWEELVRKSRDML